MMADKMITWESYGHVMSVHKIKTQFSTVCGKVVPTRRRNSVTHPDITTVPERLHCGKCFTPPVRGRGYRG